MKKRLTGIAALLCVAALGTITTSTGCALWDCPECEESETGSSGSTSDTDGNSGSGSEETTLQADTSSGSSESGEFPDECPGTGATTSQWVPKCCSYDPTQIGTGAAVTVNCRVAGVGACAADPVNLHLPVAKVACAPCEQDFSEFSSAWQQIDMTDLYTCNGTEYLAEDSGAFDAGTEIGVHPICEDRAGCFWEDYQ